MWTHPGAKLLFMGSEFGQTSEWNYKSELDWSLLQHNSHKGAKECLTRLNGILVSEPAMHLNQFNTDGFEWVDLNHREQCVIVYKRKGNAPEQELLVILNMTPEVHHDWVIEVSGKEYTEELFNSDNKIYDGTGDVFNQTIRSECIDEANMRYKITINLPPLGGLILK
ncbi:MAG: alpha amylase C-terminal domain-containing protein, partial [Niabella sp.]|nr:alpha amylase C-terminal domain-containing protein [Niabella sp.]